MGPAEENQPQPAPAITEGNDLEQVNGVEPTPAQPQPEPEPASEETPAE